MAEATFKVRVPAPLLQFGIDQNEIQRRITEGLVLALFAEGRISSDKAARLLNISRVEFLALLRARGIAYIFGRDTVFTAEIAEKSALSASSAVKKSLPGRL